MPTQKSMDLGLFVVREGTRLDAEGKSRLTKTPCVTGKGQLYFINKFKELTPHNQQRALI